MAKRIFVTPSLRALNPSLRLAIEDAIAVVRGRLKDEINVVTTRGSLPGLPYVDELRDQIEGVDMVLADLSSTWPSVLVDVGFAEALRKPVLLLAQDLSQVPAPSADRHVLLYAEPSSPDIGPRLRDALHSILSLPPGVQWGRGSEPHQSAARVFISYNHKDKEYLDRVLVHLRPLERERLIVPWSDKKIRPGQDWSAEISNALKDARAAVLLISADFLASEFIATNELPKLLDEANMHGTRIISILLKPSRFERDPNLSRFQTLNSPELPVVKMTEAEREELYAKLAADIETDLGFGASRPAERASLGRHKLKRR